MDSLIQTLLEWQTIVVGFIPTAIVLLLISQVVAKAGYSRLYVLWLLVPFLNLFALYLFLWGEWPMETELLRLRGNPSKADPSIRLITSEDVTHHLGRFILLLFALLTIAFIVIGLPVFVINTTNSERLQQFTPTIVIIFGLITFFIFRYFYIKVKQLP